MVGLQLTMLNSCKNKYKIICDYEICLSKNLES